MENNTRTSERGPLVSVSRKRKPMRDVMADDRTEVGPRDGQRVNVHEDYEVRYWTERWGVGADELKAAVARVGPMKADVAGALGKPE